MLQITTPEVSSPDTGKSFYGFALPTSNTTYTPNQFFDVALSSQSRGAVRLIGYMIRKTLGWSDSDGNPQNETVSISYNELEKHAGVSHSMIRQALSDAAAGGFIRCVWPGRASSAVQSGSAATYELAWDEQDRYVKKPAEFIGFFAGEGNRTYIPNQFFDELIPNESLAVIKVVGSVIRFSIGFQNKFGHRRQRTALSYRDIQRYAKIASPAVLCKAVHEAMAKNYIERVEEGFFDRDAGRKSRPAQYAIKWLPPMPESSTAPKSVPARSSSAGHPENRSGPTPKSVAGIHSENRSDIQITINKTLKQQSKATFEKLKAEGFDAWSAETIASRYPAERIERQLGWIDQRRIRANRLGMLRAAIDQDWSDPNESAIRTAKLGRPNFGGDRSVSFRDAVEQTRQRFQSLKN